MRFWNDRNFSLRLQKINFTRQSLRFRRTQETNTQLCVRVFLCLCVCTKRNKANQNSHRGLKITRLKKKIMYVYRIPNVKVCRQVVSSRLAQVEQTPDKTTGKGGGGGGGLCYSRSLSLSFFLALSLVRSHTLNFHLSPLASGACPASCKPL